MPLTALNDDTLIAIFAALDQWDLPQLSLVCQHWHFLVTRTGSLWLDVHDDGGYYDHSHKNPPFQIVLARSRGADVRFIDNTTGKLGGALPKHLKRATGIVLDVRTDKFQLLLLARLRSQTPLVKLRSLHLNLDGHPRYADHKPDFTRLNETNLPALRHFGLCGIEYPFDDINLPKLLTLHAELNDHRRDICALVRRYIGQPLRELWFTFWSDKLDNVCEAFPEDVAARLDALDRIYAELACPDDAVTTGDTFQRLLAGSTAEVQLRTKYYHPDDLEPAQALRAAESLIAARGGVTMSRPHWTIRVAEHDDDDFGRPAGLNMFALTISSPAAGLIRRIIFRRDTQLEMQLQGLIHAPEPIHLELDGASMLGVLRDACRICQVYDLGASDITTLTLRISAHDTSISMANILSAWKIDDHVRRMLSRIDTLVVRARPFEQVKLEMSELKNLLEQLRLPRGEEVVHVRTAGICLRGLEGVYMPPGVILDGSAGLQG